MLAFTLFTNVVSPHQLPLARRLAEHLGEENYRYLHTERLDGQRRSMGWGEEAPAWCVATDEENDCLLDCDMLFSELRAEKVFARRLAEGKLTCYVSERWFKPPLGFLRMFSPAYWRMARQFAEFLGSPRFFYFPQGIHAARDMMRIQGLFKGDLRCLFSAPKVAFESRPGGWIVPLEWAVRNGLLPDEAVRFGKRYGFARIPEENWGRAREHGPWRNYRLWGYFVESAECRERPASDGRRILWVGRMLDWKRVETLIQALPDGMELNLYGHGPEEPRLRALANGKANIHFHDFVPIVQVRELMRENDVYVLPSDGGEGWGAVLNEALEEGMRVLGTLESGAGATMLAPEWLFPAGDARLLEKMLSAPIRCGRIGCWSVRHAANYLMDFLQKNSK